MLQGYWFHFYCKIVAFIDTLKWVFAVKVVRGKLWEMSKREIRQGQILLWYYDLLSINVHLNSASQFHFLKKEYIDSSNVRIKIYIFRCTCHVHIHIQETISDLALNLLTKIPQKFNNFSRSKKEFSGLVWHLFICHTKLPELLIYLHILEIRKLA